MRHWDTAILLLPLTLLMACGPKSPRVQAKPPVHAPASTPPRVTERPGNRLGKVLILEYHNFTAGKDGMFRTPEAFRSDLERLYKMGFRPVTVSEYLANRMNLPPGASPVVITFDDSTPTQYRMLPNGSLDPDCAVAIWANFAKSHPDFPLRATFYVLPNMMWGQPKYREAKLRALFKRGCELGCHTMTHRSLAKLSNAEVEQELTGSLARLREYGQSMPVTIALPFGISPRNPKLLQRPGEIEGALLVGAGPAPAPSDPRLNRWRLPRIQAYSGASGSDFWLTEVKAGRVRVYVEP